MKGNTMFYSIPKSYSKTLILTNEPSLEVIDEAYLKHKTEGVLEPILMPLFHRKARSWFKSGFIDRPGKYKITISYSLPLMFWHKIYYKIDRL